MRVFLLLFLAYVVLVTGIAGAVYALRHGDIERQLAKETSGLITAWLGGANLGQVNIDFEGRDGRLTAICRERSTLAAMGIVTKNIQSGLESELNDKVRELRTDLKLAPRCEVFLYQGTLHATGELPEQTRSELTQSLLNFAKQHADLGLQPTPVSDVVTGQDLAPPPWADTLRIFLPVFLVNVSEPRLLLDWDGITLSGQIPDLAAKKALETKLMATMGSWRGSIRNQLIVGAKPQSSTQPGVEILPLRAATKD